MSRVTPSRQFETNFKPEKKPKQPRKGLAHVSAKKAAYRASSAGRKGLTRMQKVHLLRCCICENFGMLQTSPTNAHHPKSGRYGNLREDDNLCIPLCECHHQGLRFDRDKTKVAYHQDQTKWERLHGPDTDYIAATQDAIERLFP